MTTSETEGRFVATNTENADFLKGETRNFPTVPSHELLQSSLSLVERELGVQKPVEFCANALGHSKRPDFGGLLSAKTAIILVIDRDPSLRTMTRIYLEQEKFRVVEAANERDGLELLLRHEPNLVICDADGSNGGDYDLLQTLREKHKQFADIPFLFLT